MSSRHLQLLSFLLVTLTGLCGTLKALERVTPQDLLRARQLKTFIVTNELGVTRNGKPWKFTTKDHCNFTFFSPTIKDPIFSDGKLSFTVTGKKGIVGWGNYDGRQAKKDRIKMFPGWNEVEIKLKQSAAESEWTFELWANGKTKMGRYSHEKISFRHKPSVKVKVKGTEWQTVRFKAFKGGPDGFGLIIRGPEGNKIEIESFRITQTVGQGCYRYSFDLPKGKIWRSAVMISEACCLYVNGKEVAFMPKVLRSQGLKCARIDLAPHLKAGTKNTICLYVKQHHTSLNPPCVYMQGSVIMDSGKRIILDTNRSWKATSKPINNWTEVEFNDTSWGQADGHTPDCNYVKRVTSTYDGRLLLLNPGKDPQLFFNSDKPLKIKVRTPEGLAAEKPVLKWILRRVERENQRPEVSKGEEKNFTKQAKTGSIVYEIDAGKQKMGVYTIQVSLFSGERKIEHRFEEPLMIIGHLDMTEVSGDSFEQGMELELEDVIDFTDPKDPHRWIEAAPRRQAKTLNITKPKIIRKDGLVYREVTDSVRAAMFSYKFEFKRPFSWYMLVLEYPNDAERWTGVSVTSTGRPVPSRNGLTPWRNLKSGLWNTEDGPSVITGGKYPLDNKMYELKWLHWADPEIHTLDIVNLKKGLPAAAAKLKIYRIKKLPAVKIDTSGERFFGIHTERSISLGRTFSDSSGVGQYQHRYDYLNYDMIGRYTQRLRWYFDTCKNYTEYLRFTGQNLHVCGSFQYSEVNPWPYFPKDKIPDSSRLLLDIREALLRFFENNGITMYNMVEYVGHTTLKANFAVGNAEVADGEETISFISKDGKQGGWHANPLHPAVEKGYLKLADDMAAKFSHSPAWKGIYYCIFIDGGGFGPGPCALHKQPFEFDYSDVTIKEFEKDTGIETPGAKNDPERFRKRYLFLTSEAMKDKWLDWRCKATKKYMDRTLDVLRKYRPDLNVLYGFHSGGGMLRYQLFESDKPYSQFFREMGMDPTVVKNDSNTWFGRYIYPMGPASGGKAYQWQNMISKEANEMYYNHDGNRMIILNTCWHELPTCVPGWIRNTHRSTKSGTGNIKDIPKGWPMVANVSRFISQAHDDNVLEPFTLAMIGADPDILIFGLTDVNIINSREQHIREIAKVITPLPKKRLVPFKGTTDFHHNLAIRKLKKGNELWFYVANPGPWPVKGKVTLSGKGKVVRPCDGQMVKIVDEGGKTVIPVALVPFGIKAYRCESNMDVESWSTEAPPKQYIDHLQGIIKRAQELLKIQKARLAITPDDRTFIKKILADGEKQIKAGQYVAAWTTLTNFRFWELWKDNLEPALEFSARLSGRPEANLKPKRKPILDVALIEDDPPPVIDGKLNDPVWKKAAQNFRFLSIGTGPAPFLGIPLVDTSIMSAYDNKNLYLAFRLADPDVKNLKKDAIQEKPVQVLRKYDDTMVMFFNPKGTRVRQFAANAGGVKYFSASGEWGITDEELLEAPWKACIGIKEGVWIIEAAIPFSSFGDQAPETGDTWKANFIRRFREFTIPECYWAKTMKGWTDISSYGTMVFR